jgi:putative Holliday junction resolvase
VTAADRAGAVLGLDPGERRIGVALAVAGSGLAVPLATVARAGDWAGELRELAAAHRVSTLVVGLPVSLDGSEGPAAAAARGFARLAGERLGLPVEFMDERLSTVSAGRSLAEAGASGRRRRASVDRSAAAVILQAWLDGGRHREAVRT